MRVLLIEVNQPIGTFYLSALAASVILKITNVHPRKYEEATAITGGGVQRNVSVSRVREISEYCSDPDATFPTPIIISVNDNAEYRFVDGYLEFDENIILGEIIDGQHRIQGIALSRNLLDFTLPVVFMFELTMEEKAYVFSIINSKQTRVSMSLIYDLFDLSTQRSPQKTCHEVARLLNSDSTSPFYRRLKMLGKKEDELASLSQGSFIKYLLPLISKNPDDDKRNIKQNIKLEPNPSLPFSHYFINNQDEYISKILKNMFTALSTVFTEEWERPNEYILSKTVGFSGVMRAFPILYRLGYERKDLSLDYFKLCCIKFKEELNRQNKKLTSEFFPSNEQQAKLLSDIIIKSVDII